MKNFYSKFGRYYQEIDKEDFAHLYAFKKERFRNLDMKYTFKEFINNINN